MNRAYQACFVRMIVDWGQLYIDLFTLEGHRRTTNYQFTDTTCAEAVANGDAVVSFHSFNLRKR